MDWKYCGYAILCMAIQLKQKMVTKHVILIQLLMRNKINRILFLLTKKNKIDIILIIFLSIIKALIEIIGRNKNEQCQNPHGH